jgi:hypothetical protein
LSELSFSLHDQQALIHASPARFKVCAAGRQSGKTFYATASSIIDTLADISWGGVALNSGHEVGYIYPTFEQGKKIVWPRMKLAIEPIRDACDVYENTGLIVFPNGRRWRLLGADNPDAIRGFTWSSVVLDEYKDMSEQVWKEIVRPALSVVRGKALFIGTPKGKNHFYHLYRFAQDRHEAGDPEWDAFTFTSADNPHISSNEVTSMARDMSSQLIAQELEASFISQSGNLFNGDSFYIQGNEPGDGDWCVAVDLAGFTKAPRSQDYKKRDETAIAVAKVNADGWWVKEIRHGRWEVRETALQIFSACRAVGAPRVGIEKGALMAAVSPYLTDLMRKYNRWLEIVPLSHGNKSKPDRIQWALQGRCEKGQIGLAPGAWNSKLIEQACDFPDPRSPDDILDALAYVDQMARVSYMEEFTGMEDWAPVDPFAGY